MFVTRVMADMADAAMTRVTNIGLAALIKSVFGCVGWYRLLIHAKSHFMTSLVLMGRGCVVALCVMFDGMWQLSRFIITAVR